MNDSTSFQPSELCANNYGFFGTVATMCLCSKCYRDSRIEEEIATSAKAAMKKLVTPQHVDKLGPSKQAAPTDVKETQVEQAATTGSIRCLSCNKNVGIIGFNCRCGCTFCGTHMYPKKHNCTFDFKGEAKNVIAKENHVTKADRI